MRARAITLILLLASTFAPACTLDPGGSEIDPAERADLEATELYEMPLRVISAAEASACTGEGERPCVRLGSKGDLVLVGDLLPYREPEDLIAMGDVGGQREALALPLLIIPVMLLFAGATVAVAPRVDPSEVDRALEYLFASDPYVADALPSEAPAAPADEVAPSASLFGVEGEDLEAVVGKNDAMLRSLTDVLLTPEARNRYAELSQLQQLVEEESKDPDERCTGLEGFIPDGSGRIRSSGEVDNSVELGVCRTRNQLSMMPKVAVREPHKNHLSEATSLVSVDIYVRDLYASGSELRIWTPSTHGFAPLYEGRNFHHVYPQTGNFGWSLIERFDVPIVPVVVRSNKKFAVSWIVTRGALAELLAKSM